MTTKAPKPLLISYKKDIVSQDHQLTVKDEQLATKDQQIERLQSTLDQSPQLQALTESRYQAEHQQLAKIRSRSLFQRLKAFWWRPCNKDAVRAIQEQLIRS